MSVKKLKYVNKITNNTKNAGGNKKQGLASTTNKGVMYASRSIRNRAYGENRNVIFCMNQLGGVGRHKSQFVSTADGVKDCVEGPYGITQPEPKPKPKPCENTCVDIIINYNLSLIHI